MTFCDNCGYAFEADDEDQMICDDCEKQVEEEEEEENEDENVEFDDI